MLKLNNISKYYHSNDVVAMGLRKVTLEFKLGEFVAVTGESGSGKSTLLNVISGLDTYEDGEMYVNGEETSYFSIEEWESYRRQYIGFVFQSYNIIDSYSVLENVMVALTIQGYDKARRKERALELIDKVGLSTHVHHKASKLSGGQKQRAVIARALAKDCPIIVADEPTGNLDSETGENIMSLLKEISAEKLVIVVTHNYDQVKDYATRKIRLFDGEVVEDKVIKKRDDVTEGVTLANYRMTFLNLMAMAFKNLLRTPRRTTFAVVIAMFIALIFTFSYGSYVQGTNSNGYIDGGGIYSNVTERRIIVTKFDESPFSQSEIDTLSNIGRVRYVLNHDVILDSTIYQYILNYGYIDSYYNFVNPADMLTEGDLKAGRLPNSKYEIVVEDYDRFELGQTIYVGYNQFYWDVNSLNDLGVDQFTIVGIVKNINVNTWEQYLYFHEDFINSPEVIQQAYSSSGWGREISRTTFEVIVDSETIDFQPWYTFVIDETLNDDEVEFTLGVLNELSYYVNNGPLEEYPDFYQGLEINISVSTNFYTLTNVVTLVGEYNEDGTEQEKYNSQIAINSATLAKLSSDDIYQVAVLVQDTYDANIVLGELETLGYNAIYPASIGNQFQEVLKLLATIGFTVQLGFLMIVIYFISYVVLRNIQNAKKKDFLIFRSIGASKTDLHRVTIIELVYTFLYGYILVMIFFVINEYNQIWIIPQYLRYFTVGSYVILTLLLSALAIFLGRRFNKRIFSRSVITSLKQE